MNKIFIVSCPRSGTTMLGSMLSQSRDCFTTPESQFKFKVIENDLSKLNNEKYLLNNYRLKIWGLSDKDILGSVKLANTGVEIINNLLLVYRQRNNIEKNIWVDHTPENMHHIHSLVKKYNKAKFIFLVRDGRAVLNSFLKLNWGANNVFEAVQKWESYNATGLAAVLKYPEKIKLVRYEDIVSNPFEILHEICSFLGITFNERMISGDKSFIHDYTKSQHTEVGKIPNKEYLDKWKKELDCRDIKIFEEKSGSLLKLLGYDLIEPKCDSNLLYQLRVRIISFLVLRQKNRILKFLRKRKI